MLCTLCSVLCVCLWQWSSCRVECLCLCLVNLRVAAVASAAAVPGTCSQLLGLCCFHYRPHGRLLDVQTARARTQRTLGQPTVCPPCAFASPIPLICCSLLGASFISQLAALSYELNMQVPFYSWEQESHSDLFGCCNCNWSCGLLGWLKLITFFMAHISFFSAFPLLLPSLIAFYEHYYFLFLFTPYPWPLSFSLSLTLSLWWFFHSINLRVDLFAGDTGSCFFSLLLLLLFIWKSVQTRCGIIATCCV